MDDSTLRGLLSQLIPGGDDQPAAPDHLLVNGLKTLASQAGGGMQTELDEFLSGRGALLETTRAAGSGVSGASAVAAFLEKQLHLSPALAKVIAPLLLRLLPSIGGLSGATTPAAKPKPRRKKKPAASAHAASHSAARPKKPKTASSAKPAAHQKPRPSTSGKPKKPAAKKPAGKKASRAVEIDGE